MTRLRGLHFRASRYGAQAAASARQARVRAAVGLAVAIVLGGGPRLFACPMCFGAEETSMIDGTKLGVLVLLGIVLAVQGGFGACFLYLRKRAKRIADIDLDAEWSQLQGASRT